MKKFSVQSINISNKILTVNLKKLAVAQVDAERDLNCTWKWIMFIELDKTNLKDNMEVVVNKY